MKEQTIKVLDHGYIKLIETYGSDERIIESARMSTDKGFLGWGGERCRECWDILRDEPTNNSNCKACKGTGTVGKGDEKLLRYLYTNKHMTPFEFAGATIEVMAPIFVFREWHRHRTQSYNEMSSRYTPLPDLNYMPTISRLMVNANGSNKQAGTIKDANALTVEVAEFFRLSIAKSYVEAQDIYERALAAGIPKELARIHLPVGRYSRMRAHTDLRSWMGFLTLRNAPGAQYEIRVYAEALFNILTEQFPRTMSLFNDEMQVA